MIGIGRGTEHDWTKLGYCDRQNAAACLAPGYCRARPSASRGLRPAEGGPLGRFSRRWPSQVLATDLTFVPGSHTHSVRDHENIGLHRANHIQRPLVPMVQFVKEALGLPHPTGSTTSTKSAGHAAFVKMTRRQCAIEAILSSAGAT